MTRGHKTGVDRVTLPQGGEETAEGTKTGQGHDELLIDRCPWKYRLGAG